MIGLMAILVLVVLLFIACWAFVWAYRLARRKGKSDLASFWWALLAVMVLSLPITWDAIPTWVAFEYYKKEAGVTVFKTLDQWKLENPGVAETLVPYGFKDKRKNHIELGRNNFLNPLNDRFGYTDQVFDKLFLSVYANRFTVVDLKNKEVLIKYVEVGSGNNGGFATGGEGWWALWLINRPSKSGVNVWSEYVQAVEKMGATK